MKNKANVVIKQRIIPELVSGSSTQSVTQRQALKTLKKFQGLSYFIVTRSLTLCRHAEFISASSRYDNNQTLKQVQGDGRRGFTLIELLVVVLIIGILAAVALPQYQKAVVKSRVATILPVLDSIRRAQEAYYLSNGSYTSDTEELDINAPCTLSKGKAGSCGSDFYVDFGIALAEENPQLNAHYCPGKTTNWTQCKGAMDFTIVYYYGRATKFINGTGRVCSVKNNSALGESICKSLSKTGAPDYDDGNGNNRYYF